MILLGKMSFLNLEGLILFMVGTEVARQQFHEFLKAVRKNII
jgi:hypothetical protein